MEAVGAGRKHWQASPASIRHLKGTFSAVSVPMASTGEWDQPVQSSSSRRAPIPRTVIPVVNDWEDDDDDGDQDAPPNAENNQRIWETANAQAPASPMPALVVSGSAAVAPPAAAFQPKLRILKRPPSAAPTPAPSPPLPGETLKEREARYKAARDRIFGQENDGAAGAGDKKDGQQPAQGVLRNPRGPAPEGPDALPKGFTARSANAPPSPNRRREPRDAETATQKEPS
ncbi:hypothetical protein GGX14DRAFT_625143 [Mycena pura]|uniref:SUZ domain-containing protein n=1 Tax=Mycena pura TaxID=153505 RepID=A0AAD6VIK1_9AGAR|nr:hypothetical protein GGX14DRAFT_625143 [Mycena pura]